MHSQKSNAGQRSSGLCKEGNLPPPVLSEATVLSSVPSHLNDVGAEASVDPDPVAGGQHAEGGHEAEERRAHQLPLLAQVERVHLRTEHSQDEHQHRSQVHLTPELRKSMVRNIRGFCTLLRAAIKE